MTPFSTQLSVTSGDIGPMVSISDDFYSGLAAQVLSALGQTQFFNGTVGYDTDECYSEFTATLIMYRDGERITDIVPVWWEFHLMQASGEVLTDFSWREFLPFLLQ